MSRYRPAESEPPRITSQRIPRGYAGTRRTAAHVRRLILDGARDFYVRQKAIDIMLARGIRPKNYRGEIEALFEWVQRHVRYTKDPFRVEVLHSPRRLLELRAGDCDDMTILLGAMLEAIGHPVRLVLTGPDPGRPLLFSHIYLEVNCRGRWIPLDATMPHPMGWAPRALVRRIVSLREEEPHANHGSAGAGDAAAAGSAGRPELAGPVAPRHRLRRPTGEGSAGEAPVGTAPASGPAGARPMAQGAAPLHLGHRADGAAEAQDRSPGTSPAATVGGPAATDGGRPECGPVSRGADADDARGGRAAGAAEWPAAPNSPRGAAQGSPTATPPPDPARALGAPSGGQTGAARASTTSGNPAPGGATPPEALNGYFRQAEGLYRRFNQFGPAHVIRVQHGRVMPPVVVRLGDLVGLIYRSDKSQQGRPRTYIHRLEMPPVLVSDVAGTQLYLVGGKYRITARGIEE